MTPRPKVGEKNNKTGWLRMDCRGKKIFSPVSFTTASGVSLGENFLLLTLIAEHPLTLSFPPSFLIAPSAFIWRLSFGDYAGTEILLAEKNSDPLRIVPMSQYPCFEEYVPFSGNYLSWNRTWYPHTTSLKIKNRIVGKKTKKTQNPPTTPFLRRDRCGGQ